MTLDLSKGVCLTHVSDFETLRRHNFISLKISVLQVAIATNFKAVGQTQVELLILKFEKSDVCIRTLNASSVT